MNLCRGLSKSGICLYYGSWQGWESEQRAGCEHSRAPSLPDASQPFLPAHALCILSSSPHLAACNVHDMVTHVSIFYFFTCRQRRYLGAQRDPTFPPSSHCCHLLSANPQGIMEGGGERKETEANPRLLPDVS